MDAEGKCIICAQLQERFGFLLNKFKNAGPAPTEVLPAARALPLQVRDRHEGDAPLAAIAQAVTEYFNSLRESGEEEECNVSPETPSMHGP